MKILAAIDGSDHSKAAVHALENTKWGAGSQIKLLMVIERNDTSGFSLSAKRNEEAAARQKEVQSAASEALQGIMQEMQKCLPDCTFSYEVSDGDPKSQILEVAKKWGAELVFMGSRGNKGLDLILLGSVSQAVLMQSPVPVLIAKSATREDLHDGFQNIMITMDNSPYSRAALNWVMGTAWTDASQFRLVTVIQPLIESFDSISSIANTSTLELKHKAMMESAKSELEKHAEELARKFGKERVSIEVGEGDPREAILSLAASWPAELIVMGSHGRTGLTKLMLGSVSQAVAVHSPISVAVVKGIVPKGQTGLQQTGMFRKI